MPSIKRSLNLRQAIIQLVVFGAFSVGIYKYVESRLQAEFDKSLETLASTGTGAVEIEWSRKRERFKIEIEDEHAPAYDMESVVFAIRDPDGKVRFNPDGADFEKWSLPEVPASGATLGETTLPDGRPARYRVERFMPEVEGRRPYEKGAWSIAIVRERSSIDETLSAILFGCVGIGTLATLLTLTASYWSVQQGLRPLDKITNEVNALESHNLDHRFTSASLPRELKPIAEKLNELLVRMQSAFERERRFTSNAAHELRTPLAELHTILQLGEKWKADDLASDDPVQYFADGAAVSRRMSRLLETLFTLSRDSSGLADVEKTHFCLQSTIREQVMRHAQSENILLDSSARIPVVAIEELLVATLDNLLTNALHHGEGEVIVSFLDHGTHAAFSVSNRAPDLSDEDLKHMREPFWRKDKSRTDQSHLGLGLNLVESFCKSQGWKLTFELAEGIFTVTVSEIEKFEDPSSHGASATSERVSSPVILEPSPAS